MATDSGLDRLAHDCEKAEATVRKLRQEIIELEREVGKQCETIQSLQSELKLLRGK